MSTMTEKKKNVSVMPFCIEAKHPQNCDVAIQSLGLVLRGAVSASVEIFDKQWNDEDFEEGKSTRPAAARLIDGVGELPGMQLQVDPAGCRWKVIDPLYKNEKRLTQIKKAMKRAAGMSVSDNLSGVPPKEGSVDVHTMKTLCRELLCFIMSGEIKVIKGPVPSLEDVEELPGHFLLNASNMMGWHQPRFEKDYAAWVDRMSQISGGE